MKTGIITFNVKNRGRQHRGQPRNFDCVALAAVINSPATQERVRKRDLHGYLGHWPRLVFGLEPGEGGIYKGKQVNLEPAVVTTMLRADDAGNVSHEAEFLDNPTGRIARRQWDNRVGGFSSAINVHAADDGRDIPLSFHGFDYVKEPNFSTNRGWALDGVMEGADDEAMVLDEVAKDQTTTMAVLDSLLATTQAAFDQQAEVLARVMRENEALVAMIAVMDPAVQRDVKQRLARLDSTGLRMAPSQRPAALERAILDSTLGRMAAEFDRTKDLPGYQQPEPDAEERRARGVLEAFANGAFALIGR